MTILDSCSTCNRQIESLAALEVEPTGVVNCPVIFISRPAWSHCPVNKPAAIASRPASDIDPQVSTESVIRGTDVEVFVRRSGSLEVNLLSSHDIVDHVTAT